MKTPAWMMLGMMMLVPLAMAGESVPGPVSESKELGRIKALARRWEGTATHMAGAQEEPAAVEYKVTSGGSAVVETRTI